MDGVTILHAEEVMVNGGPPMIFFGILTSILFILCLIVFISCCIERDGAAIILLLGVIGFGCMAFACWMNVTPEYEIRQQVTVDDTVNFNEFQERYRVIKQEGLIYTVVDKEESN